MLQYATPYEEKINEFTKRLDNEDPTTVMSEMIIYLQGMGDNETNPIRREQISGLAISVIILRGLIAVTKEVVKQRDETKSQLNSQLEKIIKLEKRFDDMDALK